MDAGAPAPAGGVTAWLRRHAGKLVASLFIGASTVWILARGGLPFLPPGAALAQVRGWSVAAFLATMLVGHVLRATRWRFLLRPVAQVSMRDMVVATWVGLGAIVIAPFRTGEVVRPYLISKRGVPLWAAASTIAAERIFDGLAVALILLAGLSLAPPRAPMPAHVGDLPVSVGAVRGAAWVAMAVFVSAFVVMAAFYWRRDLARRVVRAVVGVFSPRLADSMAGIVERLADGLRSLPSARAMVPFLLETAGYWAAAALGVWLLGLGCGLEGFRFPEACVTLGVVGIGVLVPAAPGFFGAFQLSTYMALAMFYPEDIQRGAGAAFVFVYYACNLGWHLAAALVAWWVGPASPPASEAGAAPAPHAAPASGAAPAEAPRS
ncbi:MAG: lysylphosphatidylglycerol synthase transmembrane domain-containing protein [Polyangiaceae bacterium]